MNLNTLNEGRSESFEHHFEPHDLTDLTIHYCDTSFHMHSILLMNASKFLSDDIRYGYKERSRCKSCSSMPFAHHRCVTLDGPLIGGRKISAEQLRVFFSHLYSVLDVTGSFCNHLNVGDLVECPDNQGYVVSEVTSVTPGGRFVDLKLCQLNQEKHNVPVQQLRHAYSSQHHQPHHHSNSFVDSSLYFLAHCLQCTQLENLYDQRAVSFVDYHLKHTRNFSALWKLLSLADLYRWQAARSVCLHALLKDTSCASHFEWESHYASITRETLAELLALSLSQPRVSSQSISQSN